MMMNDYSINSDDFSSFVLPKRRKKIHVLKCVNIMWREKIIARKKEGNNRYVLFHLAFIYVIIFFKGIYECSEKP